MDSKTIQTFARLWEITTRGPLAALGLMILALGLMHATAQADVTFTDSEFLDSDWVSTKCGDNTPDSNGTFTAQQTFGNGNPLPSWEVRATWTADVTIGNPSQGMSICHQRLADVYDPSTQGAISSIDVALDGREGYSIQVQFFQNEIGYEVSPGFPATQFWVSHSAMNLTPADFICFGSGCPSILNFSSSGGPISFTFATSGSTRSSGTRNRLGHFDNWRVTVHTAVLPITIDVKPGSDPNCFNVDGHGVVPVAIFGNTDFDVNDIDPSSLRFGAFQVHARDNKDPLCSLEDVNGDEFDDLVCQFKDDGPDIWKPNDDATATLIGTTVGGIEFEGIDTICVVPE